MKSYKHKMGVTLIEILISVAIVVILVSTVISVATRIDSQARERLAGSTIALVAAALEQFRDYVYRYDDTFVDYSSYDFPLDCNDFVLSDPQIGLQDTLANALGLNVVVERVVDGTVPNHLNEYSGSEALYFFLNRVPESRKILERIDSSLITNRDDNGNMMRMTIDIGGVVREYPLLRIIDPWGETLRYDYYIELVDYGGTMQNYLYYIEENKRTFPVITSAGPDRVFNTADDITNRD